VTFRQLAALNWDAGCSASIAARTGHFSGSINRILQELSVSKPMSANSASSLGYGAGRRPSSLILARADSRYPTPK
jgi:hypothetical protein